jgi:DNA-binding MarR family transcriptional regulator
MAKRQTPPPRTLRRDARALIERCPGWNSRLAARRISQFLDQALAESGFSVAQLGLMALVAAAEDDTLGALARRAGLDQSTLSRNLQGLARAGLVEIAMVEKDQRRRAVWLTEAGARQLQAAIPIWQRAQAETETVFWPELARRLADAAEPSPRSARDEDEGRLRP